jgi:hypothetical protein
MKDIRHFVWCHEPLKWYHLHICSNILRDIIKTFTQISLPLERYPSNRLVPKLPGVYVEVLREAIESLLKIVDFRRRIKICLVFPPPRLGRELCTKIRGQKRYYDVLSCSILTRTFCIIFVQGLNSLKHRVRDIEQLSPITVPSLEYFVPQ